MKVHAPFDVLCDAAEDAHMKMRTIPDDISTDVRSLFYETIFNPDGNQNNFSKISFSIGMRAEGRTRRSNTQL